jgi:hypothetical protein
MSTKRMSPVECAYAGDRLAIHLRKPDGLPIRPTFKAHRGGTCIKSVGGCPDRSRNTRTTWSSTACGYPSPPSAEQRCRAGASLAEIQEPPQPVTSGYAIACRLVERCSFPSEKYNRCFSRDQLLRSCHRREWVGATLGSTAHVGVLSTFRQLISEAGGNVYDVGDGV